MRLSDVQIRAWLAAGKPLAKSDGDGLTFTLSPSGAARWVLRYMIGGRPRELRLGPYAAKPPGLTLAAARKKAQALRVKIAEGVDPAIEKRKRIAEARREQRRQSFAGLADGWYEANVRRWKHPEVARRILDKHLIPRLGAIPADEVTPEHVERTLRAIAKNAPTPANDALRILRRIFERAKRLRIVASNPVDGFRIADAGGTEPPRTRALSRHEIGVLLKALRTEAHFGRDNYLAILLLLVLGVRKGELVGARWAEFDLDAGVWTLPAERTKTSAALRIPLAPAVVAWLRELHVFAAGSEYVFPQRRRGSKRFPHMSGDTLNLALSKVSHGLEHFTIHDLRRTMRSQLAELNVAPHIAERCLNHKLPGVMGIYDTHDYFEQRKAALERWAGTLTALERGGARVVALR